MKKLTKLIRDHKLIFIIVGALILVSAIFIGVLITNNGLSVTQGKKIDGIQLANNKVFNLRAGVCEMRQEETSKSETTNEETINDIGESGEERTDVEVVEDDQPKVYQSCSFYGNNELQPGASEKLKKTNHARIVATQDQSLISQLEAIRSDKHRPLQNLSIYYGDTESLASGSAGVMTAGGKKTLSTIIVSTAVPAWDIQRVVAHEYIHYRWRYTGSDVKYIAGVYNDSADSSEGNNAIYQRTLAELEQIAPTILAKRITSNTVDYNFDSPYVKYSETIAYACTEFSDSWLTPHIINECNKIIDRSKMNFTF